MSKTTEPTPKAWLAACLFVACSFCASAQTLGELADAQRIKQQAEILKAKTELEAAEAAEAKKTAAVAPKIQLSPEAAREAARAAEEAARPKVTLHALYARNGVWVAELASNQKLALALVGMSIYGYRVMGVGQEGLSLAKPCSARDVREKSRCGSRTVAVGEAI